MVAELMSPRGLLQRRDAIEFGYDDKCLRRLVRGGRIVRIRQGAYAAAEVWRDLSARDRHLLLSDAVVRQYDEDIALSHGSAVLRLGGPDYGLDLATVHITHFDGGGRRTAKVVHHQGRCGVLDITRLEDHWVTSAPRTVLDVSYLLFRTQRVPRPQQQHEIFHPDGRLAARTDWAWPELGVIGEFDGTVKYHRFRRPDETIEQAVLREKRREEMIVELTGWRCIRLIWADLFVPAVTAQRIRNVLSRAAA